MLILKIKNLNIMEQKRKKNQKRKGKMMNLLNSLNNLIAKNHLQDKYVKSLKMKNNVLIRNNII